MIRNKKELRFFIMADRIMAGLSPHKSFNEIVNSIIYGGGIISCQKYMRMYSYYKYIHDNNASAINWIMKVYYGIRYSRLSKKLGFSIGPDVFGYGLLIPHYGTIVINGDARVGNFAVVHTCTNIAGKKSIGDGFYMSTGCQIVGDIVIGDDVSVCANSLVNKSIGSNKLVGGVPAKIIKEDYPSWYNRDGIKCAERVRRVELLREQMNLKKM